jgi:outer membrane protein assembly factor BamD (BamD/ComL family)
MKVKGIERALGSSKFGVRSSEATSNQNPKLTTRSRIITITLLLIALTLGQSVAPRQAYGLDDQDKPSSEKLFNEAKKALRKGKFERATEIYREILATDGQNAQAKLGVAFASFKLQN